MFRKFYNVLTSYPAMIALLLMYAAALGTATFVENSYGSEVARQYFYYSVWLGVIEGLLVLNFVGVSIRQKLWRQRKWAVLGLHYAFALILLGALVTHQTGIEGMMHIREGSSSRTLYLAPDHRQTRELPFMLELESFRVVRYPGSNSPSSYESEVLVKDLDYQTIARANIYMNNVLKVQGYRFYQSSFDPDEAGTVLTVSRDRVGTAITYVGYALLFACMVLALFHKNSRFRTLSRSLGRKSGAAVAAAVLLLATGGASAQTPEGFPAPASAVPDRVREKELAHRYAVTLAVDPGVADQFGRLIVQDGKGRVEPMDSYASKMLRKIAREERLLGLNADQVLLGWLTQSTLWSRVACIYVDNEQLIDKFGGSGKYLAFVDLLDDQGGYQLEDEVEALYSKPAEARTKYDKELLKLDEKVNILNALFNGQMLQIFPRPGSDRWSSPGDDLSAFEGKDSMFVSKIFPWLTEACSEAAETRRWDEPARVIGMIATYQNARGTDHIDPARIEAEMLYNRLAVFKWSAFFYMGMGLLLLFVVVGGLLRPASKLLSRTALVLTCVIGAIFLWQSFGIGLRWYVSGRAPWSNAYESMVYVGWATALAGLVMGRRSKMTLALSAFLAGVVLLVSNFNWMDPEITPLVPVLKSPWLLVHVAVIIGSYGFFGIGFLLGLVSLILMLFPPQKSENQIRELTTINEMSLIIGLILMTAGSFLGAIWANESWGRYWGWDPKETWALITVVVYALVLHARFWPKLRSAYAFNLMSVAALGTVLMTFFGVNYYLSGLHSYGGDSAPPALNVIYLVYAAVAVIALLAWFRNRKRNRSGQAN